MQRVPSVAPSSLDFSDGSYLAALLRQVVADLSKFKDRGAITDETPEVCCLCFVLEKVFLHELKTGPRGHFWEFIERLQDSLPGNQASGMLDKLRTWTRSSTGRCRSFIRLSLNQRTIIEYLQALVWNTSLVQAFYTRGAFFRNEHLISEMLDQLEIILPLQFSLTMHFGDLDRDEYWSAYRNIIQDLHIRVITGRESEFKFGLLSVEGDERRRRERERQRSNSLLGREGSAVNENGVLAAAEPPAEVKTVNSGQVSSANQSMAREPAQNTAITDAAREQEERRRKEEQEEVERIKMLLEEEAERKLAEENARRKQIEEEEERRRLEEIERQRLEEEERMVLEEARRLEEELAWRRKQRELARKKARGSNRRINKQEEQQDTPVVTNSETASEGNALPEVPQKLVSGDSSSADEHDEQASILLPTESQFDNVGFSSESESDPGTQELSRLSASDSETTREEEKGAMTLNQVEIMLRELEERRIKLMQIQGDSSLSASESSVPGDTDVTAQNIDELLEDLTMNELDNLEEVLKFCEELEDTSSRGFSDNEEPNEQMSRVRERPNDTKSGLPIGATMIPKSLNNSSLDPGDNLLGRSHIERAQHLEEVLRFCDELDEELVGIEFEQNINKQIQQARATNGSATDNPAIRILSSSPGTFQASFKREGVWGSMKQGGHLDVPVGSIGGAAHRLDHLKMRLSSSPKRDMVLFHLQQKRAEKEVIRNSLKSTSFMFEHQTQPKPASNGGGVDTEEITIKKESATANFTRGRTGSLLSQGIGESGLGSSLAEDREAKETKEAKNPLSRSSPSTPTHYSSDGAIEVIRPAMGARKNFRNSYYQALKLHSPSLPDPSTITPLSRQRNAERRQARSAERTANRRSTDATGESGSLPREQTELPAVRRKLEFDRSILTSSGRSVTLTPGEGQVVKRPPSEQHPATEDDAASGIPRRMSTSALPSKMQRPVWARDSDHSQCGICEVAFSLVVRRHHCRVCGQIFCSKCCTKAKVPDLDYDSPVPVCQLCLSTLPPPAST